MTNPNHRGFTMSQSSHRVHLELEALEERCVLSTAAYVTTLYVDLLHRVPAASEVNSWVMAINSWERINLNGLSPAAAATAFTTSPEYLNDTVRVAYQIYLNRTPAPSETAGWLAALQAGLPETQLQASFL